MDSPDAANLFSIKQRQLVKTETDHFRTQTVPYSHIDILRKGLGTYLSQWTERNCPVLADEKMEKHIWWEKKKKRCVCDEEKEVARM